MVTITVAAILLAIAVPSLREFILNNRLAAATNDLVGDLALARAEAVRRGSRVTVCASNDASAASPTCSGTDWSAGRLVFSDAGTAKTLDSGDERLRAYSGSGSGIALTSNAASHSEYIQYRPSGGTDASAAVSFKLCDSRNKGRTVTVALNGQVTTTGESGTTCP
jgi:type IV fimbrial biogenesis protein FimT